MTPRRGAARAIQGGVHAPLAHDSALKHATGEALYVDDLAEPEGLLHAAFGISGIAHGRILEMDLEAVRAAPGVVAVITAADVPGVNDIGVIIADEPIFAEDLVQFAGQCLFAVGAETVGLARRAARLARVRYAPEDPILTIDEALERQAFVLPPYRMARGDARRAIDRSRHRLAGRLRTGGQDHFYLEGQISVAIPGEDGDMLILGSTQHPTQVQHAVAKALGLADSAVVVEVRRMGGGFGGKESQAALFAVIAALLARRTGRAVKARASRDDDMIMTGKRHDFRIDYEVGFDAAGRIRGIEIELASRCGFSADLSPGVNDRAMFHCDNAYYLGNVAITSHRCKTNTVSNTAFRGYGGPQGVMAIELVIDEIARYLGKDPLDVRRANLYGARPRNMTPYHQKVTDNVLPEVLDELEASAQYRARRAAVDAFNATSPVLKKGLALTPVKFGISYTKAFMNQGGALIHVYTDGSVHLNHGGTEMGQGLFTKVAQIVAEVLQIDVTHIKITATSTGKVPNAMATSGSVSTDLNGAAAQNAAMKLKDRLTAFAAEHYGIPEREVVFRAGKVRLGRKSVTFAELVKAAYLGRIPLSATGFSRTPSVHFDRETARGRPYRYFAYGAAPAEVIVDTLTGEHRLLRADILQDAGRSLNPAIDLGQVEGGFIQGMGWLTMEEVCWDGDGRLTTHGPSTYKIPACGDLPADFRVHLFASGRNREDVLYRSKAVGEPPVMLAISVFHALRDAIASAAGGGLSPLLDAPATPERVLMSIEELRARALESERRAAE